MQPYSRMILALALCLLAAATNAATLNDAAIHKLLAQTDAAIERRDADGIAAHLSPQVRIVMTLSASDQTQVLRLSRDQYLQVLREGWAVAKNYRYQRGDVRIEYLDGASRARVTAVVIESFTVKGKPVTGKTRERVLVEMVDGRPLVVEVQAQSIM